MIIESEVKLDSKKIPIFQPKAQEAPGRLRVTKPKIDLNKCAKNYDCIVYCPHDAIKKNNSDFPVIDYNKCTGCLICLRECPSFAIEEEHEERAPKV